MNFMKISGKFLNVTETETETEINYISLPEKIAFSSFNKKER